MDEEPKVIPVLEEELVTGRREVKTGSVRVQKRVDQQVKRVESALLHDDVEVRRVAVNKVVAEAPKIRQEGETIIVPVMQEELVITKRLVLKEELHVVHRRTKERVSQDITLERERAIVERLDAQGRVITSPDKTGAVSDDTMATEAQRKSRRRSVDA